MRFYTQQHRYYCGIDLHARRMYISTRERCAPPGTWRRCHFMRKRAELLSHIQNTASQYTLLTFGKKLAYKANRTDVAERFVDPEVRKSIETNLTLLDHYDRLLTDLELHLARAQGP